MIKKIIYSLLLIILAGGGFIGWKVFGPTINAPEKKYFYIKTGDNYQEVKADLHDLKIIPGKFWFNQIAKKLNFVPHISNFVSQKSPCFYFGKNNF